MSLVIIGAGDHARVVLEGFEARGRHVAGFVEVAGRADAARVVAGRPLLGTLDHHAWIDAHHVGEFIVALGDNRARAEAFERCLAMGLRAESMIHPAATLLNGARIGPGSQVCAGAVVGLDARVGANVIINTLASIDHDDDLGDHAFVAPGAHLAGRVTVGSGGRIGIGAAVREGIGIGAWATVAAGAVVIRDVEPNQLVAGVPARPMDDSRKATEAE